MGKINSLFMMHYPANTGYALQHMERIFHEAGVKLADGQMERVHFSFSRLVQGVPQSLPPDFKNITIFDFRDPRPADFQRISSYVKQHDIKLVVAFDIQPANILCRYLRTAGVTTLIGYYGAHVSSLMPAWKLLVKRIAFLLARDKVDGMIFESTAIAEQALKGLGVPERMIDVVPLGVDTRRFVPGKSDYVYKTFGFPQNRRIVVSAGHIYEGKGVGILIDAAIQLLTDRQRQDVCFLLCGNKGRESAPYERRFAGLCVEPYIRFGGYRSDIERIFRGCFCGVVPSTVQESFAFSSIEMAASGLPVVASRIGGLTDSVVDSVTGILFEPGNARELADVIESLLDNPEVAAGYGARGRARCEQELSLEAHRDRLVAVLSKRLSASAR